MKHPEKNRREKDHDVSHRPEDRLLKDAYIYGSDSVIFDLEDAVAENQRIRRVFSLFHTLRGVDYGHTERVVRINATDTPLEEERARLRVRRADAIRIAKCESALGRPGRRGGGEIGRTGIRRLCPGRTLLMAALESPMGVINALRSARLRPGCSASHSRAATTAGACTPNTIQAATSCLPPAAIS
jgi:citrate lyase subunit beta/citryl-CoA lyase